MAESDYDVVVIGSGFGGAVTALRLTEKGYRVGVLEAGRRYTDATLPKTSWRLRRFLWAPLLGLRGIQRITLLRNLVVLSGAGVGGGSLVYANVLYRAPERVFADRQWAHITDWADELDPHYDTAERMLGVSTNPGGTLHDEVLQQVADDMGVGSTFGLTPSGVFFGEPGEKVADPYFGGEGPDRRGCVFCAECMTGCRYGAKNRLDVNYLHLAERRGARVHPDTEVTSLRELPAGGYEVRTQVPGRPWRPSRTYRATQVVLAGGPLGSQQLLHRCKDDGTLPRLSERLGHLMRTNSQSLLTAERPKAAPGFAHGVAITSSIHPDDVTHVEPVRYGRGSNAMGLLTTLLTDGGPGRGKRFLDAARRDPRGFLGVFNRRRWSERTSILVVMQALDNSLTTRLRKGLFGRRLTSGPGHGAPNPEWIPAGNEVARRVADKIGGRPRGTWGELFGAPMTAHPIGGCVIGDSPAAGVVDPYHRVYGHEGLHVIDGSTIPANLGANPALTVTALAERATALWPNRGDVDPRPALGEPYLPVEPVAPTGRVAPLPPRSRVGPAKRMTADGLETETVQSASPRAGEPGPV